MNINLNKREKIKYEDIEFLINIFLLNAIFYLYLGTHKILNFRYVVKDEFFNFIKFY